MPLLQDDNLNSKISHFCGGNGSAFTEPSRCFIRICTLPSACSRCSLHSADSRVPSSNSLIESSSGRSPRSICSTIFSSRFSDSSKLANACSLNRVLLVRGCAVGQYAGQNFGGNGIASKGRAHLNALHHGAGGFEHLLSDEDAFGARRVG